MKEEVGGGRVVLHCKVTDFQGFFFTVHVLLDHLEKMVDVF